MTLKYFLTEAFWIIQSVLLLEMEDESALYGSELPVVYMVIRFPCSASEPPIGHRLKGAPSMPRGRRPYSDWFLVIGAASAP